MKSNSYQKNTKVYDHSNQFQTHQHGKKELEMNGKKALIDSNIIIYLSKQDLPLNFFDALDDIYISIMTYMEILGYDFESLNEEKYIRELLEIFGVIYIDQEIADTTINIRKKAK